MAGEKSFFTSVGDQSSYLYKTNTLKLIFEIGSCPMRQTSNKTEYKNKWRFSLSPKEAYKISIMKLRQNDILLDRHERVETFILKLNVD